MDLAARRPLLIVLLTAAGLWIVACSAGRKFRPENTALRAFPPPTEHVLDHEAEERNRSLRRKWIEELHRTAPGVDWRAIERENGQRLQARRLGRRRDRTEAARWRWMEVGSANLSGRMHTAALSLSGDHLYAGSSLGGVWRASLQGEGWTPVSDNLYGGSHGLAVAASPDEMITSITDGGLVNFTRDGGLTWQRPTGIDASYTGGKRVLADAGSRNRVYLLMDIWGAGTLFRSEDGGASYTVIRNLGSIPGDIWMDRVNGGTLYLLQGGQTLKSDDHGSSWETMGTIPGTIDRVVLAGSEAGAPALYAAAKMRSNQWVLYRSDDAGATWVFRYDVSDFWETLTASITDPNLVFFGGMEAWRSTDGGASFTRINSWGDYYGDQVHKLHADIPGLDIVWTPAGEEVCYIATDGGLYRSDDKGETVTNISLSGLRVSQYYSTLTSANDADLILGGAQDQGYQRSHQAGTLAPRDFAQLISGDYGHLTSGDGTHNRVYSVYPGFILAQEGESSPILRMIGFPAGEFFMWMPPVLADPDRPDVFYFCATRLYRYEPSSSSAWTYTLQSDQVFTPQGSQYLSALSISPVDHNRWIAATDAGALWSSVDRGVTWELSPDTGPSSHYFYGTAIEHSHSDPLAAYLGGAGYGGPTVYKTVDGGVHWTPASDGLPSTIAFDLAREDAGSDVLYAATEAGPYKLNPGDSTWAYIGGTVAPLTVYWSVEAVPSIGVMRFGTYGRGIWDYRTGYFPEKVFLPLVID